VFRDRPLLWKLLIPFLGVILLSGGLGAFLIIRDLSSRADSALEDDLARRSLDARSLVHDRELYLLESVNLASNLRGMAGAVRARDGRALDRLLQSVLALKTDLSFLVAIDLDGVLLRGFRLEAGGTTALAAPGDWAERGFVRLALRDQEAAKRPGFLSVGDRHALAIAGAVCSARRRCEPVGAVVAGIEADLIAAEATPRRAGGGAALYDLDGRLLGASELAPRQTPPPELSSGPVRRLDQGPKGEVATLFSPLEVGGRRLGVLAVNMPTAPAFSSVQGAGLRLVVILLAGMAGVLAIGILLSRRILAQVRPLIETNRALGSGELSARAPVLGADELGELARGVNQMAEQLQASHETLESRVEQRTEEINRLLRERNEFFTGMSHELRTPLAVVLAQAKMLGKPPFPKNKDAATETSRILQSSGKQLLDTVNAILDLAKAETGGLRVDLAEERLPDAVEDVRGTIEALADANGLRTRFDVPPDLPPVLADRDRLRQIILNLVDNATKYTPAGGTVGLSAKAVNGGVEVSVSDTGVGIPRAAADRIFEPFYRVPGTEARRGQPSSGLGLALTKRLVEAHEGEIWFTSTPKKGTTFTFKLAGA
jgi:signal transduction histidine kinase